MTRFHSSCLLYMILGTNLRPGFVAGSECLDKDLPANNVFVADLNFASCADLDEEACDEYPNVAEEYCPSSCGYCDDEETYTGGDGTRMILECLDEDLPTDNVFVADLNFASCDELTEEACEEYPTVAEEYCPSSCGYCDDEETYTGGDGTRMILSIHDAGSECVDQDLPADNVFVADLYFASCDDLTEEACDEYPTVAEEYCPSSCGYCDDEETYTGGDGTRRIEEQVVKVAEVVGCQDIGIPSNSVFTTGLNIARCADLTQDMCGEYPDEAYAYCADSCGFCYHLENTEDGDGDARRFLRFS